MVQAHESIAAWLMLAELLNERVVIFMTEVMDAKVLGVSLGVSPSICC